MDQSKAKPLRILILEDVPGDAELARRELRKAKIPFSSKRVETKGSFLKELKGYSPDLILADCKLPHFDGMNALLLAKDLAPHAPVIIVTGSISEETAVECVKAGALDYVIKGHLVRLGPAVKGALEIKRAREEERAQVALKDSEKKYRTLVDNALVGVYKTNLNGDILYANEALSTMLEFASPEEMIAHGVLPRYKNQADREILIEKLKTRGKVKNFEVEVFTKTGVPRHVLISATLEGEVISGMIIGITGRKEAERQIQEQAALLHIVPDAILVRDLNGRILFWNRGAAQLYGWTKEEAIGKKVNELLYREPPQQFEEARNILIEKREWWGELHQVNKGGKEIIVESRSTLMTDQEGKPKSILVVNTDITEKKSLETQFLRAQRMESIGILAGGIAHDLNNVLSPILMSIEMLKQKFPDKQGQRILATLESNTIRAGDIVKQVLTFARGDGGEHVEVQVKHLIQEMEKIAKETFPKSIQIHMALPKDLWTVSGDATQLHQMLMNLSVNARDAMPTGGRLTLTAKNVLLDEQYARMNLESKPGPYVVLTVSDTGRGMSPGILDKIFEPFFTTKGVGKGTGLGLATVVALVKSHGGFVNVYSEVGKGTTFKVYLPATEILETPRVEVERAELPKGHGELILVVDDETSIRDITKDTLEMYDYRVTTANDGTEAVALYAEKKGEISVVLTDMVMPHMDGAATIRVLQKLDPQVKIVAMSGVASESRIGAASAAGVETFLWKPYTAEKLLGALNEILSVKVGKLNAVHPAGWDTRTDPSLSLG